MPFRHTWAMSTQTQWNAFVEVCRTGSIRAAAEACGFSQPALSRQIAALERSLGTQLLVRGSRGATPTAAGEALLPHARLVVGSMRRGQEAVASSDVATSRVTVGAVPSAAAALVPRAVQALQTGSPNPVWSIITGLTPHLVAMVRHQEIDAAVITDAPPGLPHDKVLRSQHLSDDEMVVIAPLSHRLAEVKTRVHVGELADEVWVEDNPGSETLLLTLAARAGFDARLHRGADGLLTKSGMVAAGTGIALSPALLIPALRSDLAVIRLKEPIRRGIYLLTHRHRDRDPVQQLGDSLREIVDAIR